MLAVILSSILPNQKLSRLFFGVTILLSIGLVYFLNQDRPGLALFLLPTTLIYLLAVRGAGAESQGGVTNSKAIILSGLILGSFLLILAVVLKDAGWKLPPAQNFLTGPEVVKQYWILAALVLPVVATLLVWFREQQK
ncbi:MAG: hypothetical protein A2Z27_02795 [candidate division Zixibacteria bacterium RBG_16_50_21]|nr:MAG: hypothetical protein A2Z27_02795 [candidate division Zixibacteria bacterium RBG_16_50_21]